MAKSHLTILKKPYLDAILAGRKTVELRLLKNRSAPFGKVCSGDELFLKISSGPVCALGRARRVLEFENLSSGKIARIRRRFGRYIGADDAYWSRKANSRFAVLIWLEDVRSITPVYIEKKDWRAWVVLEASKDFGLLALGPHF